MFDIAVKPVQEQMVVLGEYDAGGVINGTRCTASLQLAFDSGAKQDSVARCPRLWIFQLGSGRVIYQEVSGEFYSGQLMRFYKALGVN